MPIANICRPLTYGRLTQQGKCGEQGTAKLACKGAGVIKGEVSALQLLKPPAPNSSTADGVDNPPRDPVRHISVSGRAVKKFKKMQIANVYRSLTQQGECGKQESDKLACTGVVVIEEAVFAMQLPKTPAPNCTQPPRASLIYCNKHNYTCLLIVCDYFY